MLQFSLCLLVVLDEFENGTTLDCNVRHICQSTFFIKFLLFVNSLEKFWGKF